MDDRSVFMDSTVKVDNPSECSVKIVLGNGKIQMSKVEGVYAIGVKETDCMEFKDCAFVNYEKSVCSNIN